MPLCKREGNVVLFMYVSLSRATVTLLLSAWVKIILGCADIDAQVLDSIFTNCLFVGEVKIGEEMILFKIRIEWFVTSILLSIGILCMLLSTPFMHSKIILFLLKGSPKFSLNCKKH